VGRHGFRGLCQVGVLGCSPRACRNRLPDPILTVIERVSDVRLGCGLLGPNPAIGSLVNTNALRDTVVHGEVGATSFGPPTGSPAAGRVDFRIENRAPMCPITSGRYDFSRSRFRDISTRTAVLGKGLVISQDTGL
jgi:hypothetical protein